MPGRKSILGEVTSRATRQPDSMSSLMKSTASDSIRPPR